jgi:hypothetical protein
MKTIEDILSETCSQYRKGSDLIVNGHAATNEEREAVGDVDKIQTIPAGKSGVAVIEIFEMPEVANAKDDEYLVDLHMLVIGVNKTKADELRPDLINWLDNYPEPDRLAGGPSYIELGGVMGSQDMAFELFALGEYLKLWEVITPEKLGMDGAMADMMAGMGMIMMTGYKGDN